MVAAKAQCPDGTPPPCRAAAARPPAPPPNSVAVLYFDNLSRDTADAFLADGLTDELITRLSQVGRLQVKSRFASERARGHRAVDARELGRTLGAAYLVRGSLQEAGGRVRVNVALIQARTGTQVWGEVYERGGDLLAIQAEIARAVAGAITGRLLPQERTALGRLRTRDPAAYDLYLRGVGASYAFSEAGLRAALEFLDRAIAGDSGFADAYAQKAVAWVNLADGYVDGREGYARAREAADRALHLDSSLAMAYAVLADAAVALDADALRARWLAGRALALDPASAWGHNALMCALLLAGGAEDSVLVEARRAWEADTLSEGFASQYLKALAAMGRTDSIATLLPRMAAVMHPDVTRAIDGAVRLRRGDAAGAAERLSWSFYGGVLAAEYVRALVALGRRDGALAVVDSMIEATGRGYVNAFAVASACAVLGDADRAFVWLEHAWERRTLWLVWLRAWPDFVPLHTDPRWAALLRSMGLAS